jgi:hypothetical protein
VTDTTTGDAAVPKETFHTENELQDKPTTPSKEELETNEKNLTSSEGGIGKLGQLVFKLRSDHRCTCAGPGCAILRVLILMHTALI